MDPRDLENKGRRLYLIDVHSIQQGGTHIPQDLENKGRRIHADAVRKATAHKGLCTIHRELPGARFRWT